LKKVIQISNLILSANVSSQVSNNSAVGMIGSFVAAGLLIVVPAAAFLISVSQNDKLDAERAGRR
tara:strand:- start:695 stop:889 length:195 start_codon:yes stop_codon:yes gene_type:complete